MYFVLPLSAVAVDAARRDIQRVRRRSPAKPNARLLWYQAGVLWTCMDLL
jgi:hypothetical protein